VEVGKMRRANLLLCAVVLLILAACASGGDGSGEATRPEQETSPMAGILAGKIPVVGFQTCGRHVDSDEYAKGGSEVMRETFTCDTVMSDPRASGREVLHLETTWLEPEDVTGTWTGEATLTNDKGSWTGTTEGAVSDMWGNYNKGEVLYMGRGAYEGLTLHLLAAGTNERMLYAGWIEPSD
jgi:hypothetical protein